MSKRQIVHNYNSGSQSSPVEFWISKRPSGLYHGYFFCAILVFMIEWPPPLAQLYINVRRLKKVYHYQSHWQVIKCMWISCGIADTIMTKIQAIWCKEDMMRAINVVQDGIPTWEAVESCNVPRTTLRRNLEKGHSLHTTLSFYNNCMVISHNI